MSFNQIKGQEQAIGILQSYMAQSHLNGGYIFAGPDGIGKKLTAKTLAKALNCLEQTNDACGRCASCLKIEKDQHPDVFVIDATTPIELDENRRRPDSGSDSEAIKIDHVRQLQKEISLRPYEGRRRVFIIDNAHQLTPSASNALLKILEEVPPSSIIILVTDKPNLLFKTVISRCRAVKFYPLKRPQLQEFLQKEFSLDASRAHLLAYFSEGRIGRALRLKDGDIVMQRNTIVEALVLTNRPRLENLQVVKREQMRDYLNILAAWFYDLYLLKAGVPHSEIINLDRKDDLLRTLPLFSFPELADKMESISETMQHVEQNLNLKLLLHNLGAQLCKV